MKGTTMLSETDLWREVNRWRGYDFTDSEIIDCLTHPHAKRNEHLHLLDHFSQETINAVVLTLKRYN